jgi:aarF domain-containing kinase
MTFTCAPSLRLPRLPINIIRPRTSARRQFHDPRFSPLLPADPATLPKSGRKSFHRSLKLLRASLYSAITVAAIYYVDTRFNSAAITRSARTFYTGIVIGCDYKINFRAHPPFAPSIEAVHARNAQRVFNLIRENGGLYLKIGQAIAMQSAILPPQFQKMFSRMFDDAPQNDWEDVERVIREDFGKSPEEVFGVSFTGMSGKGIMERKARASASVAQVHWARLPDGREVAIKIQKQEIEKQIGWDLWSFKVVSRVYSWWFDLPVHTLVPYISERLQLETDFINEANNSEKMGAYIKSEPRLRDRVYIPEIYREYSSKRVLTAEWIEGTRLWDKDIITRPWLGGWRTGSPGAGGEALTWRNGGSIHPDAEGFIKPERLDWRGSAHKGGLGLSLKSVMTTMVDLFSAQMFLWGLIHCDPHPGNIFIRRLPSGKAELVLIDHGLYISISPELRHTYAEFWKALIGLDNVKITEVVNGWGVTNPDIFASATLLRPYEGGDGSTSAILRRELEGKDEQERAFEMQKHLRSGIKQILGDGTKWPRELIFIGRNLRIVQGNNQFLGSPVNRIKITGLWASRALVEERDLSLHQKMANLGRHFVFRFVLFVSDLAWWAARIRQVIGVGGGMEDELEERMKTMAKGFGVELNHEVFNG